MELVLKQRYLLLPISFSAQEKHILFYRAGTLVFDLTARLDPNAPDTVQTIDMGRFLGSVLTVRTEPEAAFELQQTDSADENPTTGESLRPAVHFTAARGWINDPNGLVFSGGTYHMFFQYNPAGRDWGNMHWGHAVSTDLFHWKERPVALFPDESGTMFSGSGIADPEDVSGLKEGDAEPLLFYYTAAGGTSKLSEGKPFTQCMAYSTDGGLSFRKYPGNPLIPHIAEQNRDPKVVWNAELHAYCLALYLREDRYVLFTSSDLIHWDKKQELALPGDSECPDLYPLCAEDSENPYWVFSGASDRYLVGRFGPDGLFSPVQSVGRLNYGTASYAAQTFSGLPNGRIVRIAWNRTDFPGTPFNGSMCTPTEMSLKKARGTLMLCAQPAKEIAVLSSGTVEIRDRAVKKEAPLSIPLSGKAQDIRLSVLCEKNAPFRFSFLGLTITVDPQNSVLNCKEYTMPLFMKGKLVDLRVITDTHAVEFYADQGEAFLCCPHPADYSRSSLILNVPQESVTVASLCVSELRR